jgi:histone-lysine N-methyltransferase SETMAR
LFTIGLHPKKLLLCVWWDLLGVVYFELLNEGETITGDRYAEQLRRVHEADKAKRPWFYEEGDDPIRRVYLHDNARPHGTPKVEIKTYNYSNIKLR